ncbi:MAG TPA: hypothetical protein VMT51_03040 [Dongiaceae bacterium]|nr:hypothetical protein [Dongiaceae bacterium]
MLPRDLQPEHFDHYPPLARKLATENLAVLRELPLSMLPNLLREAIEYDYKFPAERRALERELAALKALSPEQHARWLAGFERITLTPALESANWVDQPGQFVELLSAHLWSTHQQDAFRKAAVEYGGFLQAAAPPDPPVVPRLGITIIGQGVANSDLPLFRKLGARGTRYTNVQASDGVAEALSFAAARAKAHPAPFAHWYIDGGQDAVHDAALTTVSYGALEPARNLLYTKLQREIDRPGNGPEALRSLMARMKPADLGISDDAAPVLARFQLKVLTEGSGTQIFSTTFAQWAAREALRRAQPATLVVRFAPRQRQRPMNELLSGKSAVELDPLGSLVDGDMGAYYNWLNQQRLPGAEQSSFVAWFEGHKEAVAIAPGLAAGAVSRAGISLREILADSKS